MNNLLKRIITSIILLSILLLSLLYNSYTWLSLVLLTSFISFFEFNNLINKIWIRSPNINYLVKIVSILYLFFFVYAAHIIGKNSAFLTLYILSISVMSDVGGYIVGKTIGGKKLTKISPNKTISGSIGSFIFSLFPLTIFVTYYEKGEFISFLFFTLFLCLISQCGDLVISFFKRKAKVKDTSNILPGHGGLLDRIDGIIFVVPLSFIFLNIINL